MPVDISHPATFAVIGLVIISLWLLILLLMQKKRNTRLSRQLAQQTTMVKKTRQQLAGLQEKHDQIIAFQNSLKTAELTTLLQKPRLEAQSIDLGHKLSGKYRNIQALVEKGLSIDDIAAVLAVSTHEARQLVSLSQLAQDNSPANNSSSY